MQEQLRIFCEKYEYKNFHHKRFQTYSNILYKVFKSKDLVKEPTCYKKLKTRSCTDLFLTNCARSFYNTSLFETGLSDFHNLVLKILRSKFEPLLPKLLDAGSMNN